MTLNVLSLFAGIGGLELGLERAGMTVVGQVEINPFCRSVLEKHWPDVPKHDDVRTAAEWWASEERPRVDVICGGFPCQDISNTGPRLGLAGERSGLWGSMLATIQCVRPRFVVVENVAALLIRGLDTVLADLHGCGFDAEWSVVSACSVGAPHRRRRLFVVSYPHGYRLQGWPQDSSAGNERGGVAGRGYVHDWSAVPEPSVWGVAAGIPNRVDRTRAIGNSVVPEVSEFVGRQLLEAVA